jgi:DNA helicase-2/ATP-dependent DNA helicase PcrA
VDYSFDQTGERAGLAPGARVQHRQFGEGLVQAVDGAGPEATVTVRFGIGPKRVKARWLEPA